MLAWPLKPEYTCTRLHDDAIHVLLHTVATGGRLPSRFQGRRQLRHRKFVDSSTARVVQRNLASGRVDTVVVNLTLQLTDMGVFCVPIFN